MSDRDPKKSSKESAHEPKPADTKSEIKNLNKDKGDIEELDDKDLEEASGGTCGAYAPSCEEYS